MPGMLKNVSHSEEISIVRLDKEMIYTLDPSRREYTAMTFAEAEAQARAAGEKMKAQMAEMKKHLENLPADQRKLVEMTMRSRESLFITSYRMARARS